MTVVDLTIKIVCKGALERDIKQNDFNIMESVFPDKENIENKIREYILEASDNYHTDDVFIDIVDAKISKKYPK